MDSATNPKGLFAAWCVVGAALVAGVISLGPLLELPALLGAILLITNRRARTAADGLLLGAGLVCLLVASLNQGGPASGNLDPYPWLVAGFVLVAVPLVYRLSAPRFRRTSPRRDLP